MSPSLALASPVFRFYLEAVAGVLVVAGALIVVLRWGFRKNVDHAWDAYRGWLLMMPLTFGALFLGRVSSIVFFTVVAISGFKEFARATGLYRDWWMTGAVYAGMIALAAVTLVQDPRESVPGWYGMFIVLPVYVVALILVVPIVRNKTEGQLQLLALSVLGFIYFGWMFGHLAFLSNADFAYGYLLFLLCAVPVSDVSAYTVGRFLGCHPLRRNISPNKTWEGAAGALAVSLLLPWAIRFTLPHFSATDLILTGLIVGIGGQLGDLTISVIKRDLGIKDMGAAISGHGGILDRVDSLIFVAPLFFHMVRWFHDLH